MLEGLRKEEDLIVLVVTLLSSGCPRQAIVHACGLDERTVARWQERAGQHCQPIHEDQMMQAKLDLEHVQADEIRVKGHRMIPWMALAILVSTRLWLGGVVSEHRDRCAGRSALGAGQSVLRASVHTAGRNGRVVGVPHQYSTSLARKGQADGRAWALPVAGMAGDRDWNSDQKNREKARRRNHSAHGTRHAGACVRSFRFASLRRPG